MTKYKDSEEFIQHIEESDLPDMAKRAVIALVRHMPAADVVEVVRCKDCARRNPSADLTDTVLCTWLHNLSMPKDGFCSYGERKETE